LLVRQFLKIEGKISDGIQVFWNINKTLLSKITTGIFKVAAHKISSPEVLRTFVTSNKTDI